MKYTTRKLNATMKTKVNDTAIRRQAANVERFTLEKANVFQVTDVKDQAMFWAVQ